MKTRASVDQPGAGRWSQATRGVWRMACSLTVLGACWLAGLRLNLTGSLPIGPYLVTRGAPNRGALVLVCLPASIAAFAKQRGYIPQGGTCPGGLVPVGKVVCALSGDTVTITTAGLVVKGELLHNSRPLTADHQGRPLPHLALGPTVVGAEEVWIWSSYSPFSFDSRYFGPVPLGQIRARVRPIWTRSEKTDLALERHDNVR